MKASQLVQKMVVATTKAVCAAVFGPNGLGRDEIVILVALGLLAKGFWLAWPPGAYLIPGAILLWLAIPTRARFVTPADEPTRRKP